MEGCQDEYEVVDEDCVKRAQQQGDVGISSEWMGYAPLMADFDNYILREYDYKIPYEDQEENIKESPLNIFKILFIIIFIRLISLVILYFRKKMKDKRCKK